MSEESGRGLTGFLSRLGNRRTPDDPEGPSSPAPAVVDEGPVLPTKALRKFLATLSTREAPVLLDLGPVIGSNLNFFGESLGCKVFIEDLFADLDRHIRANKGPELATFFESRLTQPPGSVDGVLAWDLIDYLDPPAAQALANALSRILRVDGALLGFFSAAPPRGDQPARYTKFVVVDEGQLRHRPYAAARPRQRTLQNRDIIKLFEGLRVSDSFLLQSNVREILFRKPSYLASPAAR